MSDSCPDCGEIIHIGDWPFPCKGRGHVLGAFWRGDAQIHSAEKVHIFRNPQTGEVRIPGRADRPMHPKFAAAGFVREILDTPNQVRELERSQGLIHEAGNFSDSTGTADKETSPSLPKLP